MRSTLYSSRQCWRWFWLTTSSSCTSPGSWWDSGSYLLIGFWYERRSAAEAAKKAFITTRIGDVGLLIGIVLLFRATGTFDISTLIHIAQNGGIEQGTLNAAMFLIFLGAMGKSAQVPFHVWLPDAMEGPYACQRTDPCRDYGCCRGLSGLRGLMPLFELTPDCPRSGCVCRSGDLRASRELLPWSLPTSRECLPIPQSVIWGS